jgi:hypothetical protein
LTETEQKKPKNTLFGPKKKWGRKNAPTHAHEQNALCYKAFLPLAFFRQKKKFFLSEELFVLRNCGSF